MSVVRKLYNMNQLMLFFTSIIVTATLTITSPAFKNNGSIPDKYTCDGTNTNPELNISGVPENAKSLALIVDDPDAPSGTFVHWVMWNIPVSSKIEENSVGGMQGKNGKNENKYTGPCPPRGTHHYHFKMYALDSMLDLSLNTDKEALLKAMEGHVLAMGELVGEYNRKK